MFKQICKLVIVFLLTGFVLQSCSFAPIQNKQLMFITKNTCEAPCWMGITPLLTTKEDAERLIIAQQKRFSEMGIKMGYKFEIDTIGKEYYYITSKGVEIFVSISSQNLVEHINLYFDNGPKISALVKEFGEPQKNGICLGFRRATPQLVYDGITFITIPKVPKYRELGFIDYKGIDNERISIVNYTDNPKISIYQYEFDYHEVRGPFFIDINAPNPNADCDGQYDG